MDPTEITRRLAIARLAVEYYSALEKGEPFEVQCRYANVNYDARWFDISSCPEFTRNCDWRRKPAEPRRLVLYRYRDDWLSVVNKYDQPDETATFIEVPPDSTPEPKRWWVREHELCRSKCDVIHTLCERVVQVVEVEP